MREGPIPSGKLHVTLGAGKKFAETGSGRRDAILGIDRTRRPGLSHGRGYGRQRHILDRSGALIPGGKCRGVDDPIPLVRSLKKLRAQIGKRDLAAVERDLRGKLSRDNLLETEATDANIPARLDSGQGRSALAVG